MAKKAKKPSSPPATPSTSGQIRAAEHAIREHVSSASTWAAQKLRARLTRLQKDWNEIVSSLDAIGDTEQATSAYLNHYPPGADSGSRYLLAYGVLQALFIQQDAVIHLFRGPRRPAVQIGRVFRVYPPLSTQVLSSP